ncbi:uncharacterized protein [Dermacentor andersoni]|nr:uncharacterized protein LOC126541488 isoform X3 [Dermacentor andersoni]
MGLCCWLLVLTAAASVLAMNPLTEFLNEQVDYVLQSGELCKFSEKDGACDDHIGSINMWSDAEWCCCPQFYEGYVTNLDHGIRRTGDCAFDPHNTSMAVCELSFANVELHYRWLLLRRNPMMEGNVHLAHPDELVDAGNLTVTLAEGSGLLLLEEDVSEVPWQRPTSSKVLNASGYLRGQTVQSCQSMVVHFPDVRYHLLRTACTITLHRSIRTRSRLASWYSTTPQSAVMEKWSTQTRRCFGSNFKKRWLNGSKNMSAVTGSSTPSTKRSSWCSS